ncbi:2-iminobutanoate/2-iminopropanoate deaminase [Acidimicrobiaceae bacterium]|nr:2-iminobutanoate/2-iminopropanoate deaminase [Acidimicrobiaceae bacterium]
MSKQTAPIGPYTPVVRAGDWIIVSGQLGLKDGAIVDGGVKAQTAQSIENLKGQLKSVGATIKDVKKTMCFLTDMDTFRLSTKRMSKASAIRAPRAARSEFLSLPAGGAVEIEAWLTSLRNNMAGAIILVLALLAFPIIVGLSTAGIAALLGHMLYRDADERHANSELRDLNI